MIRRITAIVTVATLSIAMVGCSTWNNMSARERHTAIGVGAGAVAGNLLSGGDALSTVGGAAVGGVVGNQLK